jgi:hypothetical protein
VLSEPAAVTLTRRFQNQLGRIAGRAGNLSAAEWDALGSWNRADIVRFAERTDRLFTAARQASINASAGYYATLADVPTTGINPALVNVQPNIEAPFTNYWHQLSEGSLWADAIASGRERATSIASDLVTSTSRQTGGIVAGTRVVGWRRVLTGSSCPWCPTVATQRYRTADSADFGHDHCDCIVVPIIGDIDPGQVINARFLTEGGEGVPAIRI